MVIFFFFFFPFPQVPKNQTPIVSSIPELGVVSTHRNDWLCHNDPQLQESTFSSSQELASRASCGADDGGVHVYVHPEDGLSTHAEKIEKEVILDALYLLDCSLHGVVKEI